MAVERHLNVNDIESVICRLKDVIAVSVVTDDFGDVAEVHVLTESTRAPKQVVRDIESAVIARLGISIDHKKISIAQVGESSPFKHGRLKFSNVSITFNGNKTEAKVCLGRDESVYTGIATGTSSPAAQMKLIANATLKAIDDCEIDDFSLTLEDIQEISLGGKRVAVVLVNAVTERSEEVLTGASLIKQDLWKGVVNATLDAVNRRLNLN